MGFNWGDWKEELPDFDEIDRFAEDLAKRCVKGQTKYAITGNRMVVVTKDPTGNVRTFDTKIERFNYKFAAVAGEEQVNSEVQDDFDFEEPDENFE